MMPVTDVCALHSVRYFSVLVRAIGDTARRLCADLDINYNIHPFPGVPAFALLPPGVWATDLTLCRGVRTNHLGLDAHLRGGSSAHMPERRNALRISPATGATLAISPRRGWVGYSVAFGTMWSRGLSPLRKDCRVGHRLARTNAGQTKSGACNFGHQ